LDDDQRDALAGHLDGVGVAQLVWWQAPPDAGKRRGVAQLLLGAPCDQARWRVRPVRTQNSGPTCSSTRSSSYGCSCSQAQSSMPTWRRRPPFPRYAAADED